MDGGMGKEGCITLTGVFMTGIGRTTTRMVSAYTPIRMETPTKANGRTIRNTGRVFTLTSKLILILKVITEANDQLYSCFSQDTDFVSL